MRRETISGSSPRLNNLNSGLVTAAGSVLGGGTSKMNKNYMHQTISISSPFKRGEEGNYGYQGYGMGDMTTAANTSLG